MEKSKDSLYRLYHSPKGSGIPQLFASKKGGDEFDYESKTGGENEGKPVHLRRDCRTRRDSAGDNRETAGPWKLAEGGD